MSRKSETRRRPPAPNSEVAEQRCIESAFALAQNQLDAGTASPSVITHFLKMGTERARLEREKMAKETELLETKRYAIQSAEQAEKTISEALAAFKEYSGMNDDSDDDEEEYW